MTGLTNVAQVRRIGRNGWAIRGLTAVVGAGLVLGLVAPANAADRDRQRSVESKRVMKWSPPVHIGTGMAQKAVASRDGSRVAVLLGRRGSSGPLRVASSKGRGRTWSVSKVPSSAGASYSDIFMSDSGRKLAVAYRKGGLRVAASRDGGRSWRLRGKFASSGASGPGGLQIVGSASGKRLIVVWAEDDDEDSLSERVIAVGGRKTGRKWSRPAVVMEEMGQEFNSGLGEFDVQMSADGTSALVASEARIMAERPPAPGASLSEERVQLARSGTGGRTWSDPEDIAAGGAPRIAGSADGDDWALTWRVADESDPAGTLASAMASRSSDGGATWREPTELRPSASMAGGGWPEPRIAGDGKAAKVVWFESNDSTRPTTPSLWLATSRSASEGWNSAQAVLNIKPTTPPLHGFPPIAWAVKPESMTVLWSYRKGRVGNDNRVLARYSPDAGATWGRRKVLGKASDKGGYVDGLALAASGTGRVVTAIWGQRQSGEWKVMAASGRTVKK